MDFLLQGLALLKVISLMPWFEISGNEMNLMRALGLLLMLFFVWRTGLFFEYSIVRVGADSRGKASPGWYAISRIGRYLVWIIGAALGMAYLGFNMTNFAVLGGMIGVGVGFGLQNIISNFVSGIIILIEKIIKVDDFVDLQSGVMGKVTEINLRYTRVTTTDLIDIIVPNSEFISGRVVNWTLGERVRRLHIPFGVAYGVDKNLVKEAAIAAAHRVAGTETSKDRAPDAWLVKFGESSLDFELVVWVGSESISSPGKTQALYLWAIEDELSKRNINCS